MSRLGYSEVISNVIQLYKDDITRLNKYDSIMLIYNHIINNDLIKEYNKASLYNTIYYHLRKNNSFPQDIKFNSKSIDSKIKFIKNLKFDITTRPNHYHTLFFDGVKNEIDPELLVVDTGINDYCDLMMTFLYFRKIRHVYKSRFEVSTTKKKLGEKLKTVIDDLIKLDDKINELAAFIDVSKSPVDSFYNFLSAFDTNQEQKTLMISNIDTFKRYMKGCGSVGLDILAYSKKGYFDLITFVHMVYHKIYNKLINDEKETSNMHHIINSTSYYIYFKFCKGSTVGYDNVYSSFFSSDMYYKCAEYITDYYSMFCNEMYTVFNGSTNNYDDSKNKFDIVLKYMLYNKFRNLLNSNIKKHVNMNLVENSFKFVDVSSIDYELTYTDQQINSGDDSVFHRDMNDKIFKKAYYNFFEMHGKNNMTDITNAATEYITTGMCNKNDYSTDVIEAGIELARLLQDVVI